MTQTIVISLGGSVYYKKVFKTRYIKNLIYLLDENNVKASLVCGGGLLARKRMKNLTNQIDKDFAGISAINENVERIKKIILNLNIRNKNLIEVIGAKEPGHSSDYNSVALAKKINSNVVLNLSDIDYVYDKNPKEYSDAKFLKHLSWNEYFKIIGEKFEAGGHYPFDPVSAKLAQKNNIKVYFVNGNKLNLVKGFILSCGKKFKGTLIE